MTTTSHPTSPPSADACYALAVKAPGMQFSKVEAQAKSLGIKIRVTKKDGQAFVVTHDYVLTRLNLELTGTRVSAARCG